MRFGRRQRGGLLALILLGLLSLLVFKMNGTPEVFLAGHFSVIDGDSLESRGLRLRLLGIDAPESRQQCWRDGAAWTCGRAARDALAQLMASEQAECRGRERDRYGRMLVSCKAGGLDINAEMVRRGMAVSFGAYQADEELARQAKAGIWAGSFERPQDYRRDDASAPARGTAREGLASALRRLMGAP